MGTNNYSDKFRSEACSIGTNSVPAQTSDTGGRGCVKTHVLGGLGAVIRFSARHRRALCRFDESGAAPQAAIPTIRLML
jgi:hypothetical protein